VIGDKTKGIDSFFVDTNALVYAIDNLSPYYKVAKRVLTDIANWKKEGYISNQIITELFSALTKTNNLNPVTPLEAWVEIDEIKYIFGPNIITINDDVIAVLIDLGKRYSGIRGGDIYDMQIAATMLCYGIDTIITANEKDFAIFEPEGIKVINPFK